MSSRIRAEKEQSPVPPPSLITCLPYDIIVDIIARVPIYYYPKISLVSKSFRSIVASRELYTSRSLLGRTEHCLYAVLYNYNTDDYHLSILRREVNNNNRLVIILTLPCMPCSVSYVPVGSKIYAVGSSSSLSIDCRSHKVQSNSSIPKYMYEKVPGIINGKIYLIGDDKESHSRKRVMVLDIETQMTIKPDLELDQFWYDAVVMEDKIYMRHSMKSFVYVPKENTLLSHKFFLRSQKLKQDKSQQAGSHGCGYLQLRR
ncbi:F-box/kelch-repeat protein At4g38940 [Eutrema salsugineum]|uniref:F-box/kelch-repeat protein At4g38940 n=1 Tax=Eutrema salsugineum TaxID=72664 RepID=UPI000CED64A9|nr:F-box/kelch-repeat protein At4g38940 [Eutrema salsugineum]